MRAFFVTILSVMLMVQPRVVAAAAPATTAAVNSNAASIDAALDALDARGKDLKAFTADVSLAETTVDFNVTTTRSGKVIYQNQGDGRARIRVTFDTLQKGDAKQIQEKLVYELIDGKLIERNYKTSSQSTQQVIRPGQKLDLFKLGEGPFPLPIGQPKDEVHRQFDVKQAAASKDDPAGTVHLQLIPRDDTRLARKMKSIDAWVDDVSHMPVRIETLDKNETMDRTTNLSDVKINPDLSDADFDLGKLPAGNWNVTEQPYQD